MAVWKIWTVRPVGKVAIVNGAPSGTGRATAQLLIKEGVRIASFKNELKSKRNILRNYFHER
jgi:NAD(P)-dependent dehydrogenase (short-subunit alcohol dehydrogenase family)